MIFDVKSDFLISSDFCRDFLWFLGRHIKLPKVSKTSKDPLLIFLGYLLCIIMTWVEKSWTIVWQSHLRCCSCYPHPIMYISSMNKLRCLLFYSIFMLRVQLQLVQENTLKWQTCTNCVCHRKCAVAAAYNLSVHKLQRIVLHRKCMGHFCQAITP